MIYKFIKFKMSVKNIIIILTLSTLFNILKCSQNNLRFFKSTIGCITKNGKLSSESSKLLKSALANPTQTDNYKKIKDLLTNNLDKIIVCIDFKNIPKFPDGTSILDLNRIFGTKYDWIKFLGCLLTKVTNKLNESPLQDLIKYIYDGKYHKALREEFKLRNNGNIAVKECMPNKIKALFNVTVNITDSL